VSSLRCGERAGSRTWVFGLTSAAVVAALMTCAARAQPGTTERVSVSSAGEQGNGYSDSFDRSISADGRFVAFASVSSDLVPGDTNGEADVFVRDRQLGTTERISVSSSGEEGNDGSGYYGLGMSLDGRFVVFQSDATNLVPGDTNGERDVFLRDRQQGITERVSLSSSGEQADGWSFVPVVSPDGRFVTFDSDATNLVPDDTNGERDVFVRDRLAGTTERVSVSSSGGQANGRSYRPSISADGRFVAFESFASNLVPGDTNGERDVFERDRQFGTTERVSVSSSGQQGSGDSYYSSISADGRFVAFHSEAADLVPGDTNGEWDAFVHDRQLWTTERVSVSSSGEQGNGATYYPSINVNGRFVAFSSFATDLVPGDTNDFPDVFMHDRQLGTTELVSISSLGEQGNHNSLWPSISADGRFVAFTSFASNLVPDDTNGQHDVFVREREAPYYAVCGTMTFGHLAASAAPPTSVTVRVTWSGWLFACYEAELLADGSYCLLLPAGPLTLSTKHTHWLRQTAPADSSGGPAFGIDFSFINGDATDDNSVDILDLNEVLTTFGMPDSMGDLDESGLVDLPDVNIILVNFGLVGDT
jgi:Tol biopolymer transport system component